jgi:hypothetical protein
MVGLLMRLVPSDSVLPTTMGTWFTVAFDWYFFCWDWSSRKLAKLLRLRSTF